MPALALVRAAHAAPSLGVTTVTVLLGAGVGLDASTVVLLGLAVLSGQLVIGWSNDLVDAARDRQVGRSDKPLATGEVSPGAVRVALVVAGGACLLLSAWLGWRSGATHVVLVVGSGLAYNLGLKRTVWSWAPYAVAFGALPGVVTLASATPERPMWWMVAVGAALGVGAHLVNVLPDLAEDAATGIRGLPHRLGARASRLAAAGALLGASGLLLAVPLADSGPWRAAVLGVTAVLATLTATGRGRLPFRAALALAVVDVGLFAAAGTGR